YTDDGGAVCADTMLGTLSNGQRGAHGALQGDFRINTSIATMVAQATGLDYGLPHSSNGEASLGNPFFDSDVDILSGSDVMREGPKEGLQPFPSLANVALFTNEQLMLGDGNQNPILTQNAYDYFNSIPDVIGPNTSIAFGVGNTVVTPPIGYVTGTGANDHISIVNDPANPGMMLVTIDSYRDASYVPTSLIRSVSYDLDPSVLNTLMVEMGNGDDQLDLDPTIPGLAALSIQIFGGGGRNSFSMVDNGDDDVLISPSNLQSF